MKDCNRLNKLFVSRSLLIRFLSLIFALSGFCHLDAITIGGSPPVVGHHQSWSTITITITSGGPPPPEAKMCSAEGKNALQYGSVGSFWRIWKAREKCTKCHNRYPKSIPGPPECQARDARNWGKSWNGIGLQGWEWMVWWGYGGGSPNLISSTPFASIAKECRIGCKEINSA